MASVRFARAAVWLGPAAVLWGVLAVVARIESVRAAAAADVLYLLALPLTGVAFAGAFVAASTRRRLAAVRATALTVSLVLTLSLLELAAAARLVHWELVFLWLRDEDPRYVPDRDLAFRHASSVRQSRGSRSDIEAAWDLPATRPDRITVTYDRRGYRNAIELDRADVVLIGDSYVEGSYVSDDQTLSSLLRARIARPVANLGVAGYGTAQERIVLDRDAMPLQPRVVIWFFFEGNDLYNDYLFESIQVAARETGATPWTERHGWWRRSFVRSAYPQLRLMLYPLVPRHCPHFGTVATGPHRGERVLFWPEAAAPWGEFERDRWDRAQHFFREGARTARERDVNLLLVYVPIKFRVYRDIIELPPGSEVRDWALWPLPDLFAQFCRTEGLTCLDLTELLRDSVRAGGMPHAPTDSHWNPEGHRLIARALQERLTSLGWLRT
jgi:hypothetical protein